MDLCLFASCLISSEPSAAIFIVVGAFVTYHMKDKLQADKATELHFDKDEGMER